MYRTSGITTRLPSAASQAMPSGPAPGRNQAAVGGADDGSSPGSSSAVSSASGPCRRLPAKRAITSAATPATTMAAPAASSGAGDTAAAAPTTPTATNAPASSNSAPTTAGPMTTNRNSSLDSLMGRKAKATASRQVSPIISTRKVMLALAVEPLPSGWIAMYPSVAVRPTMPISAVTRPRADRSRTSKTMPPIAYAPTHFDANARPSKTATPRIAAPTANGFFHRPSQTGAKSVTAATMNIATYVSFMAMRAFA